MTALSFTGVIKDYRGLRPLRIANLEVGEGELVTLSGLDVQAAEVFVNLATGAALPDEGEVAVLGQPTSAITEGDSWLESLDRFGIVSHRAVLLEAMTAAQNIAMSFSLSIDPIPPGVRARVDALARDLDISQDELEKPAAALTGAGKVRVHLARALAVEPRVVLLEHPTVHVERADVEGLAQSVVRGMSARGGALLAISDDEVLGKGLKGRRMKLNAATGVLEDRDRPRLFRWIRK